VSLSNKSKFKTHNSDLQSTQVTFRSQNCEIKSRNYLFYSKNVFHGSKLSYYIKQNGINVNSKEIQALEL